MRLKQSAANHSAGVVRQFAPLRGATNWQTESLPSSPVTRAEIGELASYFESFTYKSQQSAVSVRHLTGELTVSPQNATNFFTTIKKGRGKLLPPLWCYAFARSSRVSRLSSSATSRLRRSVLSIIRMSMSAIACGMFPPTRVLLLSWSSSASLTASWIILPIWLSSFESKDTSVVSSSCLICSISLFSSTRLIQSRPAKSQICESCNGLRFKRRGVHGWHGLELGTRNVRRRIVARMRKPWTEH